MVDDKVPESMPLEPPNKLQEFAAGARAPLSEREHAVEGTKDGSALGDSTLQEKEGSGAAGADPETECTRVQKHKSKWCVCFSLRDRRTAGSRSYLLTHPLP